MAKAKVIQLWPYLSICKGLEALAEFGKTGNREGLKEWRKEYSEKIEKEQADHKGGNE